MEQVSVHTRTAQRAVFLKEVQVEQEVQASGESLLCAVARHSERGGHSLCFDPDCAQNSFSSLLYLLYLL